MPLLTPEYVNQINVAVLVPCFNEAATIARVVANFSQALPFAKIYVFDNNSTDSTYEIAEASGAIVRRVPLQGKGNVIRRMFADIEAGVYLLVDGDDTYDASQSPEFISKILSQHLDMLVGVRETNEDRAYRKGHILGNTILTGFAAMIFGNTFSDMLSGYRAFSKRYVKTFPTHSQGFEIETELSVHALEVRMPVAELPTFYKSRPEGSVSKLNTYRDGVRILRTILQLFKSEKPFVFFSIGFVFCILLSAILSVPLFETYFETGLVPRFPTAILCAALVLFGLILMTCGIVLDTVTQGRAEIKRLAYLNQTPLKLLRMTAHTKEEK